MSNALANLSPSLRGSKAANQLARSNDAKSAQISRLNRDFKSPAGRLKKGVVTLAGAFGAGIADSQGWKVPFGEGNEVKPSSVIGLGAGAIALWTGSEMLADAAIGMLSPAAYDLGKSAGQKMNSSS